MFQEPQDFKIFQEIPWKFESIKVILKTFNVFQEISRNPTSLKDFMRFQDIKKNANNYKTFQMI